MAKIHILTYKFNRPLSPPLSRDEFNYYKHKQAMGIHFEFPVNRSVGEEFASEISTLKKCFIVALLFGILSPASQICAAISGFAILIFFVCGISYLGAASSFKSAIRSEKAFYKKLRDIVLSSTYYDEFYSKYFSI